MNAGKHSIHEQKQHAARLLQGNRADNARKVLTGVCSRVKKDAEAWSMLGAANSMLCLYPEAEQCMRRVIKLSPGNHQARNNLGSALRAQGKFREALSESDKAVRINPDYAVAHFNRGGVLQDLGNIDDAIANYQQAVRLAPHDSDIHHSLAEAYQETGNLDSALKHYQHALRLNPGLVSAVSRMADIYKTNNIRKPLKCLNLMFKMNQIKYLGQHGILWVKNRGLHAEPTIIPVLSGPLGRCKSGFIYSQGT